ncbi:hypothetical protein CAI16_11760 [Virgibacillus dokdonensis]|uniref:Uncharacterized protein n=1 Tax=Virgibacillus dokdonensis TaxID=302167 RepID=A0A3E0WN79_9BACI|nr:hypothetical protein [Virgibacillus dokdonensis]RFA34258.1 hypothetical protein CAI16_11760 [Virgibacillus dokdonensis]
MKYFIKLNLVSIIYAFIALIPIQLIGNVYRINRLTGWKIATINTITAVVIIIEFIVGTILILILTKKWLKNRKANFWTMILWVPYFILFTYITASLFPIINEGDSPNPISGFFAIGLLMLFPFYIYSINFISLALKKIEV